MNHTSCAERIAVASVLAMGCLWGARVRAEPTPPPFEWGSAVFEHMEDEAGMRRVLCAGKVFVDSNGNGRLDAGERGIDGVPVSDGRQVVKTGSDGSFTIREALAGRRQFVFVTTPTGYRIGGAFFHRNTGSSDLPDMAFPLVADPASVFPDHAFIHLTDAHVHGGRWLEEMKGIPASFVVVTGDLANDGSNPTEAATFADMARKVSCPVMVLPGNHDLSKGGNGALVEAGPWDPAGAPSVTGAPAGVVYEDFHGPTYYSFDYGGRHYVLLNSVGERARQREWMTHDLAAQPADKEILVFQHYPPARGEMEFLQTYNVRALFCGHTHADVVHRHGKTLFVNSVGTAHSRDFTPLTARMVKFSGGQINLVNYSPGYGDQAAIPVPPGLVAGQEGTKVMLGQDWLAFKGSVERTGVAGDIVKPPFVVVWTQSVDGAVHLGSPVLANGRLYVGVGDRVNMGGAGVVALDAVLGKILWRYPTGPYPRLSVADGVLYVASLDGVVHAVDAELGTRRWVYSLGDPMEYRLYASPAVWNGRCYVGNGKHLAALNCRTGEAHWRLPDLGAGFWPNYASPVVADARLFAMVPGVAVVMANALTGDLGWQAGTLPINTINPATPAAWSNTLYVVSQGTAVAMNAATGEERWRRKVQGGAASPVLCDGDVIVAGASTVARLDGANGQEQWVCKDLSGLREQGKRRFFFDPQILSTPVVSGAWIHVATTDGHLVTLESDTGKRVYVMDLGMPFAASPIVSGNALFLTSFNGVVFALVQAP